MRVPKRTKTDKTSNSNRENIMKTRTQNQSNVIAKENTQASNELQKIGASTIGITSFLIGGWAVACMTAALVASGGPINLATEYIRALIG